jgi:NADH-quinone oxidoreductase subunit L
MTLAALIAVVQTDIKRVLAYSTLSQLGLMILAMGVGAWVGGLFHLITHAFFKALLFLGAGSVIHAAHHEQELTEFGGLWEKIPYTAITFGVGVLAIAGVGVTLGDTMIGLSGYYSKEMILQRIGAFAATAAREGRGGAYWLLFVLPAVVTYLTAFYMTRCWMLTFAGRPRNLRLFARARELPVMYIPLIVLAVLSVIGGSVLGIRPMLESAMKETNNYFDARLRPGAASAASGQFAGFATAWRNAAAYTAGEGGGEATAGQSAAAIEAFHAGHDLLKYVAFAFVIGIGLGVLVYWKGFSAPNALLRFAPLRWVHVWLYRAMYFDEVYLSVFLAGTLALSTIVDVIDRYVVDAAVNAAAWTTRTFSRIIGGTDDYVVDGTVSALATFTQNVGAAVRTPQTGRIRMYVTALLALVGAGLAGAILVVLSRK